MNKVSKAAFADHAAARNVNSLDAIGAVRTATAHVASQANYAVTHANRY